MNYIRFLTLYKQNSLAKKKYYYIFITKTTKHLLSKFLELGLIKYTTKSSNETNLIKIYINYSKNNVIFKQIKILHKLSQKISINIKTLNKRKQYKTNSIFLLTTSKGIITNFEAIKFNISGFLICKITY